MKLDATLRSIELTDTLEEIAASLPGTTRFDSEFPSFCFDMATGIGKTKLLAGCVAYLVRTGVSRDFFVIAPGETIYAKLIRDFTPGEPSYLFAGIAGFDDVRVVTGDDYLYREPLVSTENPISVYVFNIQKLLKGGAKQRYKFHTFQETLGASFAETMRAKGDLVVLMDESHRYRGPDYFAAIAGLKPMLGLEYTATPAFRGNVIYQYSLKQAISDGWVKSLRPIYRQNDASLDEELDDLKLRDGLLVHESTKQELDTYADAMGLPRITPMVLVNLPLIERAEQLKVRLESAEFGYAGRVLMIHSKSEDEEERRLVELESRGDVEIVLHVNRLREGWDVRNIFTIIPMRASISTTLTAQTIGRGVRLPFAAGNREELGEPRVATLSVICYQAGRDNYARIVEETEQLGPVDPEDADNLVKTQRVTVGLTDVKTRIAVPDVVSTIEATTSFKSFDPVVMNSDEQAEARLVGVDLEGEKEDIGAATATALADPVAHLAQSIIDKVPELGPRESRSVASIVKKYLETATDSSDSVVWKEYLGGKRRFVREDLLSQIKEHIQKKSSVSYAVTTNKVALDSYDTVLPVGSTVRPWKTVPNDQIRTSLVGGYEKTIYGGFRFDAQQEKWLGDALEKDAKVLEWLKVPEGKLAIRTPVGRYLPDFLALTDDGVYLVEVKRAKDVDDRNPMVVEKARRANQWCEAVSNETGIAWKYRLLRHDRVKQGDTLAGMLAGAVSIEEFIGA